MTYKELMVLISAGKPVPEGTDVDAIIRSNLEAEAQAIAEPLKEKNRELLQKLATAKEDAANLPDDFDPKKWEDLLEAEKEAKEKKLKDEQQWESLKGQMQKQHSDELKKQTEMAEKLKHSLERAMIESELRSALEKEDGSVDLMLPHLMPRMKMAEKDGNYGVVVVGQNGEQMLSKTNAGELMSAAELVGEFKANETFAVAFPAVNSGGGASGGSGGGASGGKNPFSKEEWNLTEQTKLLNTNPTLAKQMQQAAEK